MHLLAQIDQLLGSQLALGKFLVTLGHRAMGLLDPGVTVSENRRCDS